MFGESLPGEHEADVIGLLTRQLLLLGSQSECYFRRAVTVFRRHRAHGFMLEHP